MQRKWFFEIPDNQKVMAKLVEAIPSDWLWVEGVLDAPSDLVVSGAALKDTGFVIGYFQPNPSVVAIAGRFNPERVTQREIPDPLGILVGKRLPGFVSFERAGYDADVVTLDLAKSIAIGFLRKGYRGRLCFYGTRRGGRRTNKSAECSMIFEPSEGHPEFGDECGPQPARIRVEFLKPEGGTQQDVDSVLDVCRRLGLREYIPRGSAVAD